MPGGAAMMHKSKVAVIARVLPEGSPLKLEGRLAWAIDNLYRAGIAGCTPIDTPGPRWSSYVHKLRRAGFNIETVTEPHPGPYAGHHARYVLKSNVALAPVDDGEREAA